jgi:hypothetical protein
MQRPAPKTASASRITGTVRLQRPGQTGTAKARDLQRDVGARRDLFQSAPPAREASGVRSAWQAGMVEDDGRGREVPGERGGGVEMPPGRLQVEGQAVALQQGHSLAARPDRPSSPGAPRRASSGEGRGARLVPTPPHRGERQLAPPRTSAASARSSQAWAMQAEGSPSRTATSVSQRVSPTGSAGVPLGLAMDRADDLEAGRVAAVIRRQVGPAQGRVIPVSKRDWLRVAEPWMIVALEIPDMMVRIDDRAGVAHRRRPSVGPRPAPRCIIPPWRTDPVDLACPPSQGAALHASLGSSRVAGQPCRAEKTSVEDMP